MHTQSLEDRVAAPAIHGLVGGAVLVTWDTPDVCTMSRLTPYVDGQAVARPYATFTLPTTWGGSRTIVALRCPSLANQARPALTLHDDGGRVVAETRLGGDWDITAFHAPTLLAGLGRAAQARMLKLLVEFCRSTFGFKDSAEFATLCRACVEEIVSDPSPLVAEVDVLGEMVLCAGMLPRDFGTVASVVAIGPQSVRQNPFLPIPAPGRAARPGQMAIEIAIDGSADAGEVLVVLFGTGGMACRILRPGAGPRLPLHKWLEGQGDALAHSSREYVAACISAKASAESQSAAVLSEMQLLNPLPARAVAVPSKPLGGEIDLAVSHGAGGLFVAGWLHDPCAVVERIEAISPLGTRRTLNTAFHRFPRTDVAQCYGEGAAPDEKPGFITFLPGTVDAVPLYQHRFELHLGSGATVDLVAKPQPTGFAEARNAVLGSMPLPHLTMQALDTAISPPAGSLHAAHLAGKGDPEVIVYGEQPARPLASIIVPLYRNLQFLGFQLAAFALDPHLADVEIVYVLDSPEQAKEVEHLMRGMHRLYGIPVKLVIMTGNFGFASACNAGGWLARGPNLLFLNSDVIPDRPGWVLPMLGAMAADAKVGAVGPKLLYDDESLQHAGMYFDRALDGRWLNLHYHKGMPRDFGPATVARSVPAVTGAALMTRAPLFADAGGFTEDYIIGDYEDSDFCLKVRQLGHDIRYVPTSELYHLERQSIQRHAGYMRGIACEYNRRLHAEKWDACMEQLGGGKTIRLPRRRRLVLAGVGQ